MFWNHLSMIYFTPETILIHKEEQEMEYERRSVFLPPEAVERKRYTCRNTKGEVRLMSGVGLEEALEHLARIEEKEYGVLIRKKKPQGRPDHGR